MSKDNENLGMELPENFFAQEQISDEETFKSQFEPPVPFNQGVAPTDPPPNPTGTEGVEDDDDPDLTDFKFDDAIKEEEAAELLELNKKLGTNFEDLNVLKQSLKSSDNGIVNKEIEDDKRYIAYYNDILNPEKYSAKDLVREDKILDAIRSQKNIKDPEVMAEIDDEIDTLEANGMLSYAEKAIRKAYEAELKERTGRVSNHEQSSKLTEKQKEEERKQNIQESINSIFKQGKFLGVQPTKEDMIDIYKDISKNKHIEHLKANPKDAVEFALYKKYREVILKNLEKPNFNAGVRTTLNELGMSSSETGKSGQDKSTNSAAEELSYLQQFAK